METAKTAKHVAIGFALVAAAPIALVLGEQIAYRVEMMKKTPIKTKTQAFINVTNQILSH